MAEKQFDPNKDLDADQWEVMALQDLYAQEVLLQSRIDFAVRVSNAPMVEQMERGMQLLQALLRSKTKSATEHKVTVIDPHDPITIDRTRR